MNKQELKNNLYPEDIAMTAVNCECSIRMVQYVLDNERNSDTELGKKIIAEAKRLAKLNLSAKRKKLAA